MCTQTPPPHDGNGKVALVWATFKTYYVHSSWAKEEKGNCWREGHAEGAALRVVPVLQNIHFLPEGFVSVPSKGSCADCVKP